MVEAGKREPSVAVMGWLNMYRGCPNGLRALYPGNIAPPLVGQLLSVP